jgi:hypothetical protein
MVHHPIRGDENVDKLDLIVDGSNLMDCLVDKTRVCDNDQVGLLETTGGAVGGPRTSLTVMIWSLLLAWC